MNYATMLHGEPADVEAELNHSSADLVGLACGLQNAMVRIAQLERAVQRLTQQRAQPTPPEVPT